MWCVYLSEGPALAFQATLGRQGHTRPRGGTVEHDAAVGSTHTSQLVSKENTFKGFISISTEIQSPHVLA